ncbi:hypothetical protein F0562_012088 [Nyssa sinensis]|uniref:Uncharacterized protein n=1 Tax=Nyssa sinensis TaxID=561372 RepID=A0A5J4ZSK2_9ASTE|nr:hypothetical protein F0562_012088 [Nyssa sinensis]
MLQRIRWIIGFNHHKSLANLKRLLNVKPLPLPRTNPLKPERCNIMLEAVHEISIYIHRFHNLGLFQQGWYQIKITVRWEDGDYMFLGTPSRVVQYEE